MSPSNVRSAGGASTPGATPSRPPDARRLTRPAPEVSLAHAWLEMSAEVPLLGLLEVPANVIIQAADTEDRTGCWVRGSGQRALRQDLATAFLGMGFEVEQTHHESEGGPLAGPWVLRLRPPRDAVKAAGTLAAHGDVRIARHARGAFHIRSPGIVTIEPHVHWHGRLTGRSVHIGEATQLGDAVSCRLDLDIGREARIRGPVRCGLLRLAPGAHLTGGIQVVPASDARPVVLASRAALAQRPASVTDATDATVEDDLLASLESLPAPSAPAEAATPASDPATIPFFPTQRDLEEAFIRGFQDTGRPIEHDPGDPPWALRPDNTFSAILHLDEVRTHRLLAEATWLDDWTNDPLRKDGLEFDARAGRHQAIFAVRELGTTDTRQVAPPFLEAGSTDPLLGVMARVPRDVRLRGRVLEGTLHLKVLATKAESLTTTLALFSTGHPTGDAGLAVPEPAEDRTARRGGA